MLVNYTSNIFMSYYDRIIYNRILGGLVILYNIILSGNIEEIWDINFVLNW